MYKIKVLKDLGSYKRVAADNKNEIKNIRIFLFETLDKNIIEPQEKDIVKTEWFKLEEAIKKLSFEEDRDFLKKKF